MSSLATPNSIEGTGVFTSTNDGNEHFLGKANQVFVYYCSSDNFAGRAASKEIAETADTPSFSIAFSGKAIVDAVIDSLLLGITSDDLTQALPSISSVSETIEDKIVLSGTSAGCMALAHNADRIADKLTFVNKTLYSVCDANFGPDELYDLHQHPQLDTIVESRIAAFTARTINAEIARDESCMQMHPDNAWICDRPAHVAAYHINSSQVFIKADLQDPVIGAGYINAGLRISEFSNGVRNGLLRASTNESEELRVGLVSVFAPTCNKHGALRRNDEFFESTVLAQLQHQGVAIKAKLSFNQALKEWLLGAHVIAIDTVPSSIDSC